MTAPGAENGSTLATGSGNTRAAAVQLQSRVRAVDRGARNAAGQSKVISHYALSQRGKHVTTDSTGQKQKGPSNLVDYTEKNKLMYDSGESEGESEEGEIKTTRQERRRDALEKELQERQRNRRPPVMPDQVKKHKWDHEHNHSRALRTVKEAWASAVSRTVGGKGLPHTVEYENLRISRTATSRQEREEALTRLKENQERLRLEGNRSDVPPNERVRTEAGAVVLSSSKLSSSMLSRLSASSSDSQKRTPPYSPTDADAWKHVRQSGNK
ncbi:hypothetical protein [Burkholderia territorii]|uniref:hypothetical protein n=1 Tax=Burkholderia territorii TaxID=1503055 RepID=UPI0012D95F02|nr:hypothetical protein [Burkholderia territorii]